MIHPDDMKFFKEAKKAFEEEPLIETYIDETENYIALRRGIERDSIEIYRIEERVAYFLHHIEPAPLKRILIQEEEINE